MAGTGLLRGGEPGQPASGKLPNFVVIFTDDQGYGDLSCFGSQLIYTPAIDKLAREGNSVNYKARQNLYPQAISEIDWSVEQIIEALKKHQPEENTLVIFTSDNGPGSRLANAGPLRGRKGSTFEGGMRVPAVA